MTIIELTAGIQSGVAGSRQADGHMVGFEVPE